MGHSPQVSHDHDYHDHDLYFDDHRPVHYYTPSHYHDHEAPHHHEYEYHAPAYDNGPSVYHYGAATYDDDAHLVYHAPAVDDDTVDDDTVDDDGDAAEHRGEPRPAGRSGPGPVAVGSSDDRSRAEIEYLIRTMDRLADASEAEDGSVLCFDRAAAKHFALVYRTTADYLAGIL